MPPSMRNLKMIGLALHTYHGDYGCLPPAFVENSDGERMHSWRVLILPYLADVYDGTANNIRRMESRLIRAFDFWEARRLRARARSDRKKAQQIRDVIVAYDFAEPWNGPNNRRLAERRLDAFCHPRGDSRAGTDYLVVVGPETAWPEQGARRLGDVRDGTTFTMLVVESLGSDIVWSEPRDLEFASMAFAVNGPASPAIRGASPDGAHVLMADGRVDWLAHGIDPEAVRAQLTIDGQETIRRE